MVGFVIQSDPGVEIRNHEDIALSIEISGKTHSVDKAKVDTIEREILKPLIGPVGNDERGVAARAIV